MTAPGAVTNQRVRARRSAERCTARPIFPLPAFAVKAAFGQMGEEMLLGGQRVAPARLEAAGFAFAQPDVDSGLPRLAS